MEERKEVNFSFYFNHCFMYLTSRYWFLLMIYLCVNIFTSIVNCKHTYNSAFGWQIIYDDNKTCIELNWIEEKERLAVSNYHLIVQICIDAVWKGNSPPLCSHHTEPYYTNLRLIYIPTFRTTWNFPQPLCILQVVLCRHACSCRPRLFVPVKQSAEFDKLPIWNGVSDGIQFITVCILSRSWPQ